MSQQSQKAQLHRGIDLESPIRVEFHSQPCISTSPVPPTDIDGYEGIRRRGERKWK
jgi:hypothetical protein